MTLTQEQVSEIKTLFLDGKSFSETRDTLKERGVDSSDAVGACTIVRDILKDEGFVYDSKRNKFIKPKSTAAIAEASAALAKASAVIAEEAAEPEKPEEPADQADDTDQPAALKAFLASGSAALSTNGNESYADDGESTKFERWALFDPNDPIDAMFSRHVKEHPGNGFSFILRRLGAAEDQKIEDFFKKNGRYQIGVVPRGLQPGRAYFPKPGTVVPKEVEWLTRAMTLTAQIKGVSIESLGERLSHDVQDENSESSIPPFDASVIKGIYKDVVDTVIRGTTMQPQFVYSIVKAIVGTKMAGNMTFEDLTITPTTYLALCGLKNAGKGEAWRRLLSVLTVKLPTEMERTGVMCGAGFKIINSADSGAGLKDTFLDHPEEAPVVVFVDEISSLGHKANEKKNPEIIDTMGELADSTSFSRAKAKKSQKRAAARTKDNAYLTVVLCGQNAEVWTSAFTGRTNVGWWDRLTPEHGVAQIAGDLPPISTADKRRLLSALNSLPYHGTMTTSPEAKNLVERFWKTQPPDLQTISRLKNAMRLDAYLIAFGRGSMVVELADMEDAIKIFTRQLAIRRVMFHGEAPNRVGFYLGLIKELTDWMKARLAEGQPEDKVARSWRDYEKKTNARRNNEEDVFGRAMAVHVPHHLRKVSVRSPNGTVYERFLPQPDDE